MQDLLVCVFNPILEKEFVYFISGLAEFIRRIKKTLYVNFTFIKCLKLITSI